MTELRAFVQTLPQGGGCLGTSWYHAPQKFESIDVQRNKDHLLLNGVIHAGLNISWNTQEIKKYLEIAKKLEDIIIKKSDYYAFFRHKKTYAAVIEYGDPYKLGGYEVNFRGTPPEIKERAESLRDSMWRSMGRNGEPYVSVVINGQRYTRNLKKHWSSEWTCEEACRRLRNQTTYYPEYGAREFVLWALQNPQKRVGEYKPILAQNMRLVWKHTDKWNGLYLR